VLVEREADESLHLSLHAKLPAAMSMREASRQAKARRPISNGNYLSSPASTCIWSRSSRTWSTAAT
jgi:hypothetical protein